AAYGEIGLRPEKAAGNPVYHPQSQREKCRQNGGPRQEDPVVLLDQLEETRPTLGHSSHQADDRLILAPAHGRAQHESHAKIEIEKVEEIQVPQAVHRSHLIRIRERPTVCIPVNPTLGTVIWILRQPPKHVHTKSFLLDRLRVNHYADLSW